MIIGNKTRNIHPVFWVTWGKCSSIFCANAFTPSLALLASTCRLLIARNPPVRCCVQFEATRCCKRDFLLFKVSEFPGWRHFEKIQKQITVIFFHIKLAGRLLIFVSKYVHNTIYLSIPVAPSWSLGHSSNVLFHFSFLILESRWDSLDGWSTRRKAATYIGQHKYRLVPTSMPWMGWEPTIPLF
jgi:hypothetical protein